MLKKKYRFNQDLFGTPPGFIMGNIKGVVMHPDNDASEQGCIIGSGDEVAVVTKDWTITPLDTLSIPDNEIWFLADSWYEPSIYNNPYENWENYQDELNGLLIDREERSITINGLLYYRWVFNQPVTTLGISGADGHPAHSGIGILGGRDDYNYMSKIYLPYFYINRLLDGVTRDDYSIVLCNSYQLQNFTLPFGISYVANSAFAGCSSLTFITIPNSVTSIGDYAFRNCSSLASVTIPNSVTSIGNYAFENCSSLTSVTIPNSVTSIGYKAFSGCSALKSITCEATIPPTLDSGNYLDNVTAVYVPAESVDLYKEAANWALYSDVIQAIL